MLLLLLLQFLFVPLLLLWLFVVVVVVVVVGFLVLLLLLLWWPQPADFCRRMLPKKEESKLIIARGCSPVPLLYPAFSCGSCWPRELFFGVGFVFSSVDMDHSPIRNDGSRFVRRSAFLPNTGIADTLRVRGGGLV